MLSAEQTKHLDESKIAMERALVWKRKADELGLTILAGFWQEVHNLLRVGRDMQLRALCDSGLLQQATSKIIETQKRGLFDGVTSTQEATGEKTKTQPETKSKKGPD
jgi:hypothetical protein